MSERDEIVYPLVALAGSVAIAYVFTKGRGLWNAFVAERRGNVWKNMKIQQVTMEEECDVACLQLRHSIKELKVLGFDCEWVTVDRRKQPVALVQLAAPNGLCVLFRVNLLTRIPASLKEILEDKEVWKVGVCPTDDAKKIFRDFGISVQGCLDLRHLYPTGGGLATLAMKVLKAQIDKDWTVRCSNWEAEELTAEQADYAAKDAMVAVEIYKRLIEIESTMFWGLWKKRTLSDMHDKLVRYLDVNYNVKPSKMECVKKEFANITLPQNPKKPWASSAAVRKSPLYDNCFMYAPDGELLCSCDVRKAEWYVMKGLAEEVPGNPFSVRLKFEPSGRAGTTNEERFYTQLKQNRCVVCGAEDSFLRHNVVPREYRRLFPKVMKNHQSHDIVLTCVTCHHLASIHDLRLRERLAEMCNSPRDIPKFIENKTISDTIKAAKALLQREGIPPAQIEKLEEVVRKYHGDKELTPQLLKETVLLNKNEVNPNYVTHGSQVVNYFVKSSGGLLELEKMWREHFLETMKPKFLPALWSVSHNHERLLKRAAENRVDVEDLKIAGLGGVTSST